MDNFIQALLMALAIIAAVLSLLVLFARSALNSAIALLGVLICSAGIYGIVGEHFVAAIQLLVYAGAIMVLFIFSIMLLNFQQEKQHEIAFFRPPFWLGLMAGLTSLVCLLRALKEHYASAGTVLLPPPQYTEGNTKAMASALFANHYLIFEVVSVLLLVAIVAAVVLAQRIKVKEKKHDNN